MRAWALWVLLCLPSCGEERAQDSLAWELRPVVAADGGVIQFGDVGLLVGPATRFRLAHANVELMRTESMLRYEIAAEDRAAFTDYIAAHLNQHLAVVMFGETIALHALDLPMPASGLLHLGDRAGAEDRAKRLARRLAE